MEFLKNLFESIKYSHFFMVSNREIRQVTTLFILAILIFSSSKIYSAIATKSDYKLDNYSQNIVNIMDSLILVQNTPDSLNRLDRYIVEKYKDLNLFNFNPNNVTESELINLGFTEKQVSNLVRYRNNGGVFKTKSDFRKLYGLRTKQYQILEPYINLPINDNEITNKTNLIFDNKKENKPLNTKDSIDRLKDRNELFNFDPNFVTEEEMYKMGFSTKQIEYFIKMRNDGKKFYIKKDFSTVFFIDAKKYKELEPYININIEKLFNGKKAFDINIVSAKELSSETEITEIDAEKIILLREKLGGFYSPWQISDCEIKYENVKKYVEFLYVCSSWEIKKQNINSLSKEELINHPYISEKQAEAIISFKENKGKIMHLSDLQTLNKFDNKELKKLDHYFTYK
ncbi:MAG: helix-hairpin-helix domain-containing protein [Bacteroidales bacterium]|nr:helix-hairpin-helix domain-containing protein [Bacteroidales bacterium]